MQHISRTLRYLRRSVAAPRRTFRELADDPHHVGVGVGAVLLLGALYTMTVAGLALADAQVMVEPWLRIPSEQYYYWETFFTIPVLFCGVVLGAGVGHLLAKSIGGQGTFERTFALLGIASTLPWYVTWVVETVGVILILGGAMTHADWVAASSQPGFWQVFAVAYQAAALAWYLVLMTLALGVAHGLRIGGTLFAGGTATFVQSLMLFVAIR